MKLKDYLNGWGKTAEMAAVIGLTESVVSFWANGKRQVPAERCPAIEEATNGLVTCEELRPDINWSILRRKKTT